MTFGSVVSKEPLRGFSGTIIAFIEVDAQGNQRLREFSGQILGYYDAVNNVTREFSGYIIGKGNIIGVLLAKANLK